MDSYILPGLSFLPSSREAIAAAQPLSADFLKYQLSRTPTPKRFSRDANRAPRAHLDPETPRVEGNLSLTKTDFRPASQLISHDAAAEAEDRPPKIAERWSVPKRVTSTVAHSGNGSEDSTAQSLPGTDVKSQMSAVLEKTRLRVPIDDETDDLTLNDAIREAAVSSKMGTAKTPTEKVVAASDALENIASSLHSHVSDDHPSTVSAKKTVLKRPKKRHPLPSAPPVRQQRAESAEIPNNRQFSILDDERPAKSQKQKRPRIARNLPVDELELAEERSVLPYDAPPMYDSDEADSDPVEEPPAGRVRRLRDPKKANARHDARLAKKKQVPLRSSRKRLLTLSGFIVIKPRAAPVSANEKKTWQPSAPGDGFEGRERLPTGRNSRPTKTRRRTRQQIARPTLYYNALEILESKTYEVDFLKGQKTPKYAAPATLGSEIAHHKTEDAMVSDAALSDDLLMEAESGPAIPVDADNVVETIEFDAMDVDQDTHQHLDPQAMKIFDASAQESQTEISMPDVPFQTIEMNPELAPVEEEIEVEKNKDVQSDQDKNDVDNSEVPQDIRGDIQTDSEPQVEYLLPKHLDQMQEPGLLPPAILIATDDKKRPVTTKIKRQVTFSDEVKIQTVVEPESEEEYESDSEDQSQESESESGKSQSTDSEPEKSQEEDDDSSGSDDDGDEDPTRKLDDRAESPELVSSGYYVGSSSPSPIHFSFHADRMQSIISIADDDNVEGDMILDMDDELAELSDSPSYTPQSKKYLDEIADSDDEMLIPTSRATSAERMLMPSSDGVTNTDYGEEELSDNVLVMQPRPSNTEHGVAHKSNTQGSDDNLNGTEQAFFGVARFSKDLPRNLTDSGISMMPSTSFAVSKQSRGAQISSISPPASRKIKRAKTGLTSKQHSTPPPRQVSVRDVPSYFTQASAALSTPLKNVQVMMRRVRTLSSTQYVSESSDDEGFIISVERFRDRLQGRKRHLSLSDSVDHSEPGLRDVVRKINKEMELSGGKGRMRSLPFKSPMNQIVGA